uniref:Nudix hydrolase domain-containing protein n=1 Tax=Salix viminalis TaxID=40686 RepID=A0A6N2K4Y2_SALVM
MPYRIAHPDIELENSISEIWDQRVQKNASMFNGKKFRYGGHTLCKRDGSQQDFHVCLHLDDLIQCQHTSCPLGNGAILETSDKKIVVLQRSYNVGGISWTRCFPRRPSRA